VQKRVCYIHVGPHKTGTTSIQWFLKENRAELLKHGYFVPESGNIHGGHHPLVMQLCGQEVPEKQQEAAARFAGAIKDTVCEAVVISSEALDGLLRNRSYAREFFNRIGELNLEPKLVFFPRNQPQLINSHYVEAIKGFRRSESFETFVQGITQHLSGRYSLMLELPDVFGVELIACPFTGETSTHGVVPEFLRAIGIDPSQFPATNVRRNQAAGPFTVSVARCVSRSILSPGEQLTWRQAVRCKRKLTAYLQEKGLADTGYCGLTTALARHVEKEWQLENDAFAQHVWGRPWTEIFGADIGREFSPNDLDTLEPDETTKRQLRQAVGEMTAMVKEIMLDPTLAVQAAWNDLQQRAG
jgi:hypothetical protein